MIIGLSGRIKSGKTTAATIIKNLNPSFQEKYFAYKLKLICALLTGDDIKDFETQEGKDGLVGDGKEWGMTRRKMLQQIGTETLRNGFDTQIWIKSLFSDYRPIYNGEVLARASGFTLETDPIYPNWIVSDTRFPNEADEIKHRGGVIIRINRPYSLLYPKLWDKYLTTINMCTVTSDEGFRMFVKNEDYELFEKISHPSEIGLDEYGAFDCIIDNSTTLEQFTNQLNTFLKDKNLA